jgi:hypothetical protein
VERSARSREDSSAQQLLAIFDVLDDVFRRGDRDARAFTESLAIISRGLAVDQEHIDIRDEFQRLVDTLALEAELDADPEFALSYRLLLGGAVVRAIQGDDEAALRAKAMGVDLVSRHSTAAALTTTAFPVAAGEWSYLDLDSYALDLP